MDKSTHTVTIPLSDYQELQEEKERARNTIENWQKSLSSIQDFVSYALDEVEEPKRLIDEFNKRREDVTILRGGENDKEIRFNIHAENLDE